MNRRDALSRVALLFGGTIIGAEFFLSGCKNPDAKVTTGALDFSSKNISFLDEVAETILPETPSSPGAKAAKVGDFMKTMVTDCYDEKDQKIFMEGIGKLDEAADKKYGKSFIKLSPEDRKAFLIELDKEAKDYTAARKDGDPNHYFSMMKQLTLLGFFTSEVGATKALRYVAVPGKWEGCVDYKKGDKAWAT
ncbi:MAG: gluconate 2-dehydrogenase subunit 3 family protein [Bacteroidota bacterium]